MELEEHLKHLPLDSGVYQFFDKNSRLLYIGKAKILKNRIKSYYKFAPTLRPSDNLSSRIYNMICEVYSVNYIVVQNENDALILENSLIKQLKPKYNILLRDDKTYPYIYVDFKEKFPRLELTRKIIVGEKVKYFGPYSVGARDMLDSIYELIPLVQKSSCIKGKKACLFYQINRCLAPCENKISEKEYKAIIDKALYYIQNKAALLVKLKEKMKILSDDMRFEEAMILRNRIIAIDKSQIKSTLDWAHDEDCDLFVVKLGITRAVIVKMFIRNGKLISANHDYVSISSDMQEIEEIYKSAIVNYYSSPLPFVPKIILVDIELEDNKSLEKFIRDKFDKNISIVVPKKGNKKHILEMASKNCVELLKIDNNKDNTIYPDLQYLFNLYKTPKRFECFDNSHIMGQATVGAMIVWDDNDFNKEDYRLYNLDAYDEYGQMRETLMRRVAKFKENPPPDMWVIDGGLTLLKLAHDICNSAGVTLDIIAISKEKVDTKAYRSKGNAKDILYTLDNKLKLLPSDKRLQFIQRLRDEAHRRAINFHKKKKREEDKKISLLEINGIGKAKIEKLISYFGTFKNIKEAKINVLKDVLNEKDSILVFNHFNITDI